MKRVKIATMVMTFFILFIGISGTAFGATTYTTNERDIESTNLFKFWTKEAEADNDVNGDGHKTEDWTRNHYSFTNLSNVFCVDPGTDYAGGVKYEAVSESVTSGGKYTASNAYSTKNRVIISYLIGQTVNGNVNFQYVQAAIWVLVTDDKYLNDKEGYEGLTAVNNADEKDVKELLDKAEQAYEDSYNDSKGKYIVDGSLCQPSLSTSTLSFTYDSSLDAYVSSSVKLVVDGNASSTVSISGAPSGSYMLVDGSDEGTSYTQAVTTGVTIKVVVPRESISGSEDITLKATGKGTNVYVYTGATIYMATSDNDWANIGEWGSKYKAEQVLTTANYTKESGSTVTATGTVETGNLKLGKLDTYGKYVAGAIFKVTGPNGFTETITTTSGTTTISGVPVGEYTITETKAPTNMILNSTSVTATVKADKTVTSTITNEYQRGSVKLTKYDADNRGATLGDATLEGAVYSLYAKNDIYEGSTLVYSAGQLVKSGITTDENGETTSVDDLPIGTYYYKETQPSPGFKTNSNKIEVTISYAGQNEPVAAEAYNEASEEPIYVNVEIDKKLSETDYDAEINLAGVQFKLTSVNHPDQVYYTNVSGSDGKCTVENIPYGLYTASEVQWPDEALPVEDFEVDLRVAEEDDGKTFTYTKIDKSKTIQVEVYKSLIEETIGKTDAKVEGAVFTIYKDEDCTEPYIDKNGSVVTLGPTTTIEYTSNGYPSMGYAITGTMRTGIYYVKETTFPEGIDPDTVIPGDTVTYREKVYTVGTEPKDQTVENVVYTLGYGVHDDSIATEDKAIRNKPDLGYGRVIKYDNNVSGSEETPSTGAKLRLTLDSSNGEVYYDAIIDEDGFCEFINEEIAALGYEATIPYGTYTITEIKESDEGTHTHFYIQPEQVKITYDGQIVRLIFSDEPVPAYLKLVKKDADTGQTVELAGTKFKIWSVENDDWVYFQTQHEVINELVTNEEGWLMTPQQLQPGTYVIYESDVAEGYYWEDSLREPENEEYLGNVEYGGVEVVVDKVATGLSEDAEYPEGGYTGDLYIEVDISDRPVKGTIEVYKEGEVLIDVTSSPVVTSDSGDLDADGEKITATVGDTLYTFIYEYKGLEGVTYEIEAAEDIVSSDGNYVYHKKGWTTTITTGADGYATSEELYLGTYIVREIEVPEGYVLSNEEYEVTLEYENQYVRVVTEELSVTDERQKLELTFKKEFEDLTYTTRNYEEAVALFGVYTSTDIKINNITVSENSLVDLIWTDEESQVTSNVDLPAGTYYVKELYVSYPYTMSAQEVTYDLAYPSNSTQEFVVYKGEDWVNEIDTAPLILLKLSTTSTAADHVLSLSGSELTEESELNLDNLSKEITEAVQNLTVEETEAYINKLLDKINGDSELTEEEIDETIDKIITVSGVTYQLFVDKECTQPLYKLNEETGEYTELVTITTELAGAAIIYDLPYGTYYIKEISAPKGYTISNDIVEVIVNETTGIPKVFQITLDDSIGKYITKTDIFTGDVVPNCTFEITDEEGNVLVHAITDEEGNAYMPIDLFEDGETYYYTEIDAPDEYNIDTTPHEFVAQIEDNDWIAEPISVTNTRKTGTVQIIKSDADTDERLQGCVFTIVLLDDEGNEYVNAAGETIYLVQDAVTDENGEYLIEDVPYGTYKFVEMVAPEGYELDEDMTGLTFTVSDEATYIVFEVTNTGDIAVTAIAGVLMLSIVGIVTVVILRKKITN